LTGLDPGGGADGLPEGAAHALRDTVCPCTGCLLILAEDVVGVRPEFEVIVCSSYPFDELPVDADTRGFKALWRIWQASSTTTESSTGKSW